MMIGTLATFLMAVPLHFLVGRDWIPPDDQSEFQVLLNLPEGSSLAATAKLSTPPPRHSERASYRPVIQKRARLWAPSPCRS